MTYNPSLPGNRKTDPEQAALIDRALESGSVTEAEMGALRAAALYADAITAQRARDAVATARIKKERGR